MESRSMAMFSSPCLAGVSVALCLSFGACAPGEPSQGEDTGAEDTGAEGTDAEGTDATEREGEDTGAEETSAEDTGAQDTDVDATTGMTATGTTTTGTTTTTDPATGSDTGTSTSSSTTTTGTTTGTTEEESTGDEDPNGYAEPLDGLFLDAPCTSETPTPLPDGATCDHVPGTQRVETEVTFGGEQGVTYDVRLRVRGIWEPTNIAGGTFPDPELPFKVGGDVAAGNAIDYQQYFIRVSSPEQTYWLNDYQYTAHVIYKEDYETSIVVEGGATIQVVMNDGNERQIANFPGEVFDDLPPYDQTATTGQFLHFDVVSVTAQ